MPNLHNRLAKTENKICIKPQTLAAGEHFTTLTHQHMTEHSMCQPGRPFPQGLGHAGSPGLLAFQRAKSVLLLFSINLSADTLSSPRQEKSVHLLQLAQGSNANTFSLSKSTEVSHSLRDKFGIFVVRRRGELDRIEVH